VTVQLALALRLGATIRVKEPEGVAGVVAGTSFFFFGGIVLRCRDKASTLSNKSHFVGGGIYNIPVGVNAKVHTERAKRLGFLYKIYKI
jgi:hypothetical protein